MKIPAVQRRYCPYCRKHTLHTVKIEKVRKTRRALSLGERKKRRRARGHGNHGKYSKRPISQRKRVVKNVHKVDLRLTCKECGKTRSMGLKRVSRVEIKTKRVFILAQMEVLRSLRFILPAYFANASAVLRGKYFGRTRMDGGLKLGDKDLLGPHKTREGFIGASLTAFVISVLQRSVLKRPEPLIGFLLGVGAMTGDALGSFIKRRIGVSPGGPLPVLDQVTFLIVAIAFVYPIYEIPLSRVLFLLIFTPAIHLAFNLIAYRLGLKEVRR